MVHGEGERGSEPTLFQCLAVEVHGLRFGWGRMMMVGHKGGGTSPTRDGMLPYFVVGSEEAVEGPVFWQKRNRPGRFKSPRKTTKTRKKSSGGMVEVVRRRGEGASPPRPIVGSERSCPENKNRHQLRVWERRDVVVGWEGRGTSPPMRMLGLERS